jgi:CheY-like chemotaxis protein
LSVQDDVVTPMPTVLIVDDNADMLDLIADTLEMDGFQVLKAVHGEQAWNTLTSLRNVNGLIVLSDVKMPKIDGFELLRLVRSSERLSHVPFLLMSGDHSDQTAAQAAQADEFVLKPFRIDVLQQKLAAVSS